MNQKQQWVMWTAIVVVCAMCLFPPWTNTARFPDFDPPDTPGGYAPITSPPTNPHNEPPIGGVQIDFGRLFLQMVIVASLTAGAYLKFKE